MRHFAPKASSKIASKLALLGLLLLANPAHAYLAFRLSCVSRDVMTVVSVDKSPNPGGKSLYRAEWVTMLGGFDRDFSSKLELPAEAYQANSYLEGFTVASRDSRLRIRRLGRHEAFSADLELEGRVYRNLSCQRNW